jgi:hypothetical protein
MKNAWKWILGIMLVLVILAAPLWLRALPGMRFTRGFDERGPMMMERQGWTHPDLDRGFRGPMRMHMRGDFGFFGPFALLGGLVKLALFGSLLYGAYWLGRRNARLVLEPAPVRSSASVPPEAAPPDENPRV